MLEKNSRDTKEPEMVESIHRKNKELSDKLHQIHQMLQQNSKKPEMSESFHRKNEELSEKMDQIDSKISQTVCFYILQHFKRPLGKLFVLFFVV